eukprot:TRINITY_DN5938_c0_g1_i1.p1 TRINITY_DN5938_c0_g1~~TRINITY_DN5938_c0_g1_i1.p1  ORF type:complete len:103 (-),score=15.82 TRINITY_DN5938_c0_g1_i1:69-377(-)
MQFETEIYGCHTTEMGIASLLTIVAQPSYRKKKNRYDQNQRQQMQSQRQTQRRHHRQGRGDREREETAVIALVDVENDDEVDLYESTSMGSGSEMTPFVYAV